MADAVRITAPATSANLGPGFDTLAVALDLTNEVVVTRRPGPLEVTITGEGAGELPADATNLVCRAMSVGLGDLDGLAVECVNRIPLASGLGSSAAAVSAGLVAANALAGLRWTPEDLVRRGAELEGHADNVGACVWGGIVAAAPGGRVTQIPTPDDLLYVVVTPDERVSTGTARRALPDGVAHGDIAVSIANAVALALRLERGDLEDLAEVLEDRVHEPYRAAGITGIDELRGLVGQDGCIGATISGSGPTMLLWCTRAGARDVADRARSVLDGIGVAAEARVLRIAPGGVRARWADATDTRLAKAVG